MLHRFGVSAAVVVGAALVAGCGVGEAGIGLPQQRDGEMYPGLRREMVGEVRLSPNSCYLLEMADATRFVIWPAGSQQADGVRLPNGDLVGEGDSVVGSGTVTPVAPIVADRAGYWAGTIGYCAPGAAEVVVLDDARRGP